MPMPFDTQFEDEPIGPLSRMSAPVRKADGDSVRATTASGKAINRGKSRMDQEAGRKPLNVIKEEGGNWLSYLNEDLSKSLKKPSFEKLTPEDLAMTGYSPEEIKNFAGQRIINKYVDKNLTNYIKKQMGTPSDPVRLGIEEREQRALNTLTDKLENNLQARRHKLFDAKEAGEDPRKIAYLEQDLENYERQIRQEYQDALDTASHNLGDYHENTGYIKANREYEGFPAEGVAKTKLAKKWESKVDEHIRVSKAEDYYNDNHRYTTSQNDFLAKKLVPPDTKIYELSPGNIGSRYGFDHALEVLKELIAAGKFKPEQVPNLSVDGLLQIAAKYDKELANKKIEEKKEASQDALVHKEYPDGYKWIRLNKPGQFAAESEAMGHSVKGYEPPEGHPDWVEASGDAGRETYGNGGWEAIKSGKTKVYSLVDKKNEPHVTIETADSTLQNQPQEVKDDLNRRFVEWLDNLGYRPSHEEKQQFMKYTNELLGINKGQLISQIKRKNNRVADEDHPYKPYIQDFIKSGDWTSVGDIDNASMYGMQKYPQIVKKYGTPWITQEEYDESFNDLYSEKPKKEPGMKKGGSFATNIAQMRHELGIKHMNEGGLPNGLESPNPYDEAPRLMSPNDQPLRSDIEVERFKKDMMQRSQLLRKASPDDIRLQLNAQAEMGEKDRGGGTRIGALIPVNLGSMGRLTINPFTSGQAFKGEGQKSQGHWNKPGININWQKQFDNGGSVKGKQPLIPKKTVKAYKLFRVDEKKPGKLFPLFVDANSPVEKDQWVAAKSGEMSGEKVKSKIGPLAYRPGWHAGDLPVATHIGGKSSSDLTKPDHRPNNQVWAEVEMPNDVDWQSEANKRGTNKQGKLIASRAHITDQIPEGGHYRYKTNPNMTGNWLIGGAMKVNRVLPDKEVQKINKKAKVADLPREEPIDLKRYGFRSGGGVQPLIPRFKD